MDSGHARSQPFSPMGTQHSGYRRWLRSADRLAGNAAAARLRRRIDRRCLTAPRAASRDQISMAHDIAYSPIAADPLLLEALRNKLEARKSVVWGQSVSVSVDLGGGRIIKKKK